MNHRGLIESADLIPQLLNVAARPGERELGAGAIPVRPVHRAALEAIGKWQQLATSAHKDYIQASTR